MEVTVSSKGQVVIPKKIRQSLGIAAGSCVDFVVQDDVLQLRVVRHKTHTRLEDGHGMLKNKSRALAADFDVASLLRGRM